MDDWTPEVRAAGAQLLQVRRGHVGGASKGHVRRSRSELIKQNQTEKLPGDYGVREVKKKYFKNKVEPVLNAGTELGRTAVESNVLRTGSSHGEPARRPSGEGGNLLMSASFHGVDTPNFKLPTVCQLTHSIPDCLGMVPGSPRSQYDRTPAHWCQGHWGTRTSARIYGEVLSMETAPLEGLKTKPEIPPKYNKLAESFYKGSKAPKLEILVEYIIFSSSLNPCVAENLASVKIAYTFKIKGSIF